MRHYCAINGGRLVGRGARNQNQPTALRAIQPSLSKRGLRPFLDNPDNLTRMYTLWRDLCLVRCQGRSVQGLVSCAHLNGRNAFHFASSICYFFFLFFFYRIEIIFIRGYIKIFIEKLNKYSVFQRIWKRISLYIQKYMYFVF